MRGIPRSSRRNASAISARSAIRERPRLGGQAEPLVAGGPALGEVGRQVLIGVAEPIGTRHPHLLAAQPLAQRLQHADLVVDPIHPLPAAGRVLDHDLAPLRADHALDGDLVGPEVLPPLALRAPDRVEGIEQRAVRAVVGAEVERSQQLGHHPAIVGAVRGAHRGVDAPALRRAERPGFADQRLEGVLAGDGEDDLAHHAVRPTDRSLGNLEQDAGLAPDLPRLLDQLLHHPALGLDGNAVRDLDQQLDQAIDHLALARHAVEGQQRQADALGVSAQLPGALDRRTSAETLDLVRVQAAQQVRRQREATQHLELADLGQQAFQPDPAGVGDEAGERRALAVVGEQRVEPPACAGVETIGHALQGRIVVRGAGGTQDAVEPVRAGSDDPAAGEPSADLRLQRRRGRLAWQQLVGEPAAERGLGRVVEAGDRKVGEDGAAMPTASAANPIVTVEHVDPDADLRRQMPDHRRGEVGLVVREAAVPTPVGELRGQAELAGVGQAGQQRQVLGQERPALAKLVRRPQPPHRPTSAQPRKPEATGRKRTSSPQMAKTHSFAVTGPSTFARAAQHRSGWQAKRRSNITSSPSRWRLQAGRKA